MRWMSLLLRKTVDQSCRRKTPSSGEHSSPTVLLTTNVDEPVLVITLLAKGKKYIFGFEGISGFACRPGNKSARDQMPRGRPIQPECIIKRPGMYVAGGAVASTARRAQVDSVAGGERCRTGEVGSNLADCAANAVALCCIR